MSVVRREPHLALALLFGSLASASLASAALAKGEPETAVDAGSGGGAADDEQRRPLRIAVYELEVTDVSPRHGRVVTDAVLGELRKLQRVSVIGMDEIRAMLDHEATKQMVGCEDESCLSELADALGVDVLIIGSLAAVHGEHIFGLKRIDQRQAKVTGSVTRRFEAGSGEEFLVAVGPAVAELFPEMPLREGMERGVAKELALRLNPPPLPSWVFWSGAATTTALGAGAGVFAALSAVAAEDRRQYVESGSDVSFAVASQKAGLANQQAILAVGLGAGAAALALATGVVLFFTDFWGYAEMNEEAQR